MDPDVQNVLERIYEENSAETFLATSETLQPESSMVVIDPYTGDVLGLVGARAVSYTHLDAAAMRLWMRFLWRVDFPMTPQK